jgi:hypothetical protein
MRERAARGESKTAYVYLRAFPSLDENGNGLPTIGSHLQRRCHASPPLVCGGSSLEEESSSRLAIQCAK